MSSAASRSRSCDQNR